MPSSATDGSDGAKSAAKLKNRYPDNVMKASLTWFRMAFVGLLFVTSVFAGSSTFLFAQNTGVLTQQGRVDAGTYLGSCALSAPTTGSGYVIFNGPTGADALFEVQVDTNYPTGTYYVGTIPGGDDIYIVIY